MISLESAKKLKYLFMDENKIDFIQTFIKIADKSGNIVPFILTPEQKEFLTNIDNKNIVLKSRQLGLSVCAIAESIRECVTRENCTCALISHIQSSCNAVFDKLKQQYNSLPGWLKPKTIQNNRQALTFHNGSSIVCLTAGTKDLLRGSTITGVCHLSEIAFYTDIERQLKSISQACSESSTLILESTANGYNGFSTKYFESKNGDNDFKPFFFNWINGKTLFKPQYDIAVKKWLSIHNGELLKLNELDAEELELYNLGASIEQLIWRRSKISANGLEAFHVEFPSSDEECFLSTGSQVYDTKRIQNCINSLYLKPLEASKLKHIPASLIKWVKNGSLKLYELPQLKIHYYGGVDVSEGIGKDSSACIIMNKSGQEAAMFKNNRIKPYEFADVLNDLGKLYNNAHLVIEKASGGHSVIEKLRYEHKYMNLAKYKTYDEFNKIQWRIGFDTNGKTKGIAVNDSVEWFDKGLVQIRSKELLEEMQTFIVYDNGVMGAVTGCHDDLVSALWLCIAGIKLGIWYL